MLHPYASPTYLFAIEQAQAISNECGGAGIGTHGVGGSCAGASAAVWGNTSSGRGGEMALALARAGLTEPVLRAASAEGLDVYAVLKDVAGLSVGERLAIATAIRR